LQAEDADATTSNSDEEADTAAAKAAADKPANGTKAPAAAAAAGQGPKTGTAAGGRLTQDEQSATGGVSWAVVKAYVTALGGWPVVFLLFSVFIVTELFRVGSTVWLSIWTGRGWHGPWGRGVGRGWSGC
jgi:hypothetical protein